MTIYFLKGFNNYFNRTVKKYNTIADYQANCDSSLGYPNINFNPADGVSTELIVGGPSQQTSFGLIDWDTSGSPDYAVVSEYNNIVSRWFITECVRTRSGQFQLTLKRDVVADHLEDLMNVPIFVEKGMITNINNPLLFNNESMTYNQIKESEYLLKDSTNVPWIIGYVAKNYPEADTEINALISTMLEDALTPEELPFAFDLSGNTRVQGNVDLKLQLGVATQTVVPSGRGTGYNNTGYIMQYFYNDAYSTLKYNGDASISYPENQSYSLGIGSTTPPANNYTYLTSANNATLSTAKTEIDSKMITFSGNAKTLLLSQIQRDFLESTSDIEKYRGRLVLDSSTNKYYRISFEAENSSETWYNYLLEENTKAAIAEYAKPSGFTGYDNVNANKVYAQYRAGAFKVKYTEVNQQTITMMLQKGGTAPNRGVVNNSVFDIFALPYGEMHIVDTNGTAFTTLPEASMAIGRSIATTLGGAVYDLQLLPYCPIQAIRDYYATNGDIDLRKFEPKYWATAIQGGSSIENPEKITVLFWATSSSGTFDIPLRIDVPQDPIELKVHNETTVSRLCSPNYASMFEFSLAKNNGLDYINVDYNYRPYSPYIHLNPNFKGLYGTDFNDARGLICGGDFTISSISDAWQNYQIQNKNFQAIFDRQIQNMDVNNAIALEQQQFQAITGSIAAFAGGSAGGAIAGAQVGGPYGAAIGAAIGGPLSAGASIAGAVKDKEWLLRQQKEAKSFALDMYGYQLGNIQALPYSLSKTDSLTENNKLWPFLEIYTCTEKEKTALRNKLKYNGMTVMSVETLIDTFNFTSYAHTYLKGKIIRMRNINDDSHILNEIYSEFDSGLYIIGAEIRLKGDDTNVSTAIN